MAITRAQLLAMNEAQLRQQVLIPLFRKMGYQDVNEYHGSQELGKDIVMWRSEGLFRRVNYAVVAKAAKLSGKAKGKGGAGEVSTQILQCFGEEYTDPVTLEKRTVDRVWVVTNKQVKRETLTAIASTLDQTLAKGRVDFMNGDELWEYVAKHLSLSAELQALADAGKTLGSLSDNYKFTAQAGPDGVKIVAQARHPDAAKVEPLTFGFKVALPNTPEGKQLSDSIKKHIETGAGLTIPTEYIKDFSLPEIWKQFAPDAKWGKIEFGPRRRDDPVPVTVVLRVDGRQDVRLDDVEFRITQGGTQEVTLDNHHQKLPWQFRLRASAVGKNMSLDYSSVATTANVKTQLLSARVQLYMSEGAVFILEDRRTGIEMVGARLAAGIIERPQEEFVELLEKLFLIQTKARVPLSLPDRDIEHAEIQQVNNFATAVERGIVEGRFATASVSITRQGVQEFLAGPVKGLMIGGQETWSIFDTPVPVGAVVSTLSDLVVADPEALRAEYESKADAEEFDVILVPPVGQKGTATVRYLRFLPKDESERWYKMFPGLRGDPVDL